MLRYLVISLMSIALLFTFTVKDVHAYLIGWRGNSQPFWAQPATNSGVQKVKPAAKRITKVKAPGRFTAISRFMPFDFGAACYQPVPLRGQALLGARAFFAQERGKVRHGVSLLGTPNEFLEFERDLGIKGYVPVLTVMGQYQFLPRWGIRYSFTPIDMEGSNLLDRSFTFHGRSFTMGSRIHTKWQRYDHRAGLVYQLSRKPSSVVSAFAEWLHSQTALTLGNEMTAAQLGKARWDDDKNLAVLGIEIEKCFNSFRSSTIGLKCKGSFAFLDNHTGYAAEASLSYIMPFSGGHFGFLRGGYRFSHLEKDLDTEHLTSQLDGGFVELTLLL